MPLTSVQTTFSDAPLPGYPGQLAEAGSASLAQAVRNFRTETILTLGRGVVKGTANAAIDPILTPFGVKTPLSGSVLADFVGIAIRGEASTNDDNGLATTLRATTMNPVAELGSGAIVYAEVPPAVTIAHGEAVYMSVSHASIPVGAFTNAAGTGLIAITGATWYGAAAASTVGRIKL